MKSPNKITLPMVLDAIGKQPYYHMVKGDKGYDRSKRVAHTYGFNYEETWNLDYSMICFILPRLVWLRDHTHSYPPTYICGKQMTYKGWIDILNTIINGLFIYVTVDEYVSHECINKQKWVTAKQLLFDYFEHLWD